MCMSFAKQLLIYFPRQYRLPTISDQECWTQAMKTTNSTYLHENRSQIPHKCTPPAGPSLSENFFVVVCVYLQLADGVEGFFLPKFTICNKSYGTLYILLFIEGPNVWNFSYLSRIHWPRQSQGSVGFLPTPRTRPPIF